MASGESRSDVEEDEDMDDRLAVSSSELTDARPSSSIATPVGVSRASCDQHTATQTADSAPCCHLWSYFKCTSLSCRYKGKGSPYTITERRVAELIPVLCSQPAGDVSHKPGGRLPLLFARPAATLANLKRAATNFAAW